MSADSEAWWQGELSRLLPEPPQALQEALEWFCCPVCRVLENLAFSFFRDLPVRWPREPGLRQAVTASGGFCNHHSWRLAEMQSQVAVATVFVEVAAALAQHAPEQDPTCPVCRLESMAAEGLLELLATRLQEDPERERFREHFGLCYPHWRAMLRADLPAPLRAFLIEVQAEGAAQMWHRLRGFLDKNTTELKWTRTREEQRATRYAMLKTAGNEDL
jgi:hypothetical protein